MNKSLYIHLKLDCDGEWPTVGPRSIMHMLTGSVRGLTDDKLRVEATCTFNPAMREIPYELLPEVELAYVDGDQTLNMGVSTVGIPDGAQVDKNWARQNGLATRPEQTR